MKPENHQYTSHVGRKFNADGSPRLFPGTTIISFIPDDSSVWATLHELQATLSAQPYAHKFAPLPPSSFHMTVMSLLNDQGRRAENWSKHLHLDTPLQSVDAFLVERMPTVPVPNGFDMAFSRLPSTGGLSLYIEPADDETDAALSAYRNQIADVTGVRHPDHETYRYHISLAYRLIVLTDAEQQVHEQLLQAYERQIRANLGRFRVGPPQLTFFDTMFEFVLPEHKNRLLSRT